MEKPEIVFLDEYTLGGADLSRLKASGNYTGYENTSREEVAERCRTAEIVITNKVVLDRASPTRWCSTARRCARCPRSGSSASPRRG